MIINNYILNFTDIAKYILDINPASPPKAICEYLIYTLYTIVLTSDDSNDLYEHFTALGLGYNEDLIEIVHSWVYLEMYNLFSCGILKEVQLDSISRADVNESFGYYQAVITTET